MEAFIPSSSHSNCVDLCSHYESFVKDISPFRAKGMLPGLSVLSGGWKVWLEVCLNCWLPIHKDSPMLLLLDLVTFNLEARLSIMSGEKNLTDVWKLLFRTNPWGQERQLSG